VLPTTEGESVMWDSQPVMSYLLSGPGIVDIDSVYREFGLERDKPLSGLV
jgi:hypothetical protein